MYSAASDLFFVFLNIQLTLNSYLCRSIFAK